MKAQWAICLGLFLSLSSQAYGESAVSKFWNKEFPKNLGCGPGNLVFDEDSWFSTAMASSVNLSSTPLLPLSTTSGISGCNGGPPIVENSRAYHFIVSHMSEIMRDAAHGGGESLEALASLWNLSSDQYPKFVTRLNRNFSNVFGNGDLLLEEIYQSLYAASIAS
ncbi:DUF3015 family protein [Pseudobacteriovorax antillogorgiicola]|uniref:DUF3015 domain-containing protein n=1 Tax=Pseudobacteriovorax antillogorgiicola TaxID=1513793 RepID=A0A1Y6BTF0_9BACT|nr:DUF3015 family protein [Pseudobacteriovorax antillogorgiicola]TCS52971.1 DUF3015 family protein [Pseudobacteriovorax antillogorgiicola]SMF27442.1 Protein of unknown function [Pseudobacteriovorax antillogorgiicola]